MIVKLIKSRARVHGHCFDYISYLKWKSKTRVLWVQCDNASKFFWLKTELMKKNLKLTTPTPYSRKTNGSPEGMNRDSKDNVRARLKESDILWKYWKKAPSHAVTLHNCTETSAMETFVSPCQSFIGNAPDNSKLRIFKWAAYLHIDWRAGQFKLVDRAELGV